MYLPLKTFVFHLNLNNLTKTINLNNLTKSHFDLQPSTPVVTRLDIASLPPPSLNLINCLIYSHFDLQLSTTVVTMSAIAIPTPPVRTPIPACFANAISVSVEMEGILFQ